MIFNSVYDIQSYLLDNLKKIDEEMKKEYMRKRLEKWCTLHDCHLDVFPSGVVCISYHSGEIDSELYTSLTACYNSVFVGTDSEE